MNKILLVCLLLLQSGSLAAAVDARVFVDTDDGRLFLEVSGPTTSAPLILFLHGGPGSVAHLVMFKSTVGRALEKKFLVAYLHQRGVGNSSSVPDSAQTMATNVQDVDRVVNYLAHKYKQKRVDIVGHSWGGMLAGSYAVAHPEKIEKLVLMNTAMNFERLLDDTYQGDMEWARKTGNDKALSELTGLSHPFDTPEHFSVILSWADQAGGTDRNWDMDAYLRSQHLNADFPSWKSQQGQVMSPLIPEMLKLNLSEPMEHLRIPVLFVCGGLDTIVREVTMRRDYENYRGPKKFVMLEHSHHLPFIDEPDALADALRSFLREQ